MLHCSDISYKMEIVIKSRIQGAKEAEGLAVIFDVFRASNTIIAILGDDARYIIPVETLEEAYKLKKQNKKYLLFGEREGLKAEGCEYSNSPCEASGLKLKGKRIVLTTSAGTRSIINASNADEVIIGSFANASAVIEYIKGKNPSKVSLVAVGTDSTIKAEEDEKCAEYIRMRLLGNEPDFEKIKEKVLKSEGADRLRKLRQDDDLDFCLELDSHDVVPVYDRKKGKIMGA